MIKITAVFHLVTRTLLNRSSDLKSMRVGPWLNLISIEPFCNQRSWGRLSAPQVLVKMTPLERLVMNHSADFFYLLNGELGGFYPFKSPAVAVVSVLGLCSIGIYDCPWAFRLHVPLRSSIDCCHKLSSLWPTSQFDLQIDDSAVGDKTWGSSGPPPLQELNLL